MISNIERQRQSIPQVCKKLSNCKPHCLPRLPEHKVNKRCPPVLVVDSFGVAAGQSSLESISDSQNKTEQGPQFRRDSHIPACEMKGFQVVLNIGKVEVEFVCENKGGEAAVEYRHVCELEAQLFRRPKLFTPACPDSRAICTLGKKPSGKSHQWFTATISRGRLAAPTSSCLGSTRRNSFTSSMAKIDTSQRSSFCRSEAGVMLCRLSRISARTGGDQSHPPLKGNF